jgi:hypothetical protein
MREMMTFSLAFLVLELLDLHLQDVELLVDLLLTPLIVRMGSTLHQLVVVRPTLITLIRTRTLLRREEEVPDSATRVLCPRSWLELREVRPVCVRRSFVTRVREVGGEVVHHRLARTVRSSRSSRTSGRLSALRFGLEETTPGGSCLHRSLGSFTGEARFDLPCLDDVERL